MAIFSHRVVNGVSRSILDALNLAKERGAKVLSDDGNQFSQPALEQLRDANHVLLLEVSGVYVPEGLHLSWFTFARLGEGLFPGSQVFSIYISTPPVGINVVYPLLDLSVPISSFSAGTIAAELLKDADDIYGTDIADQLLGFNGNDFIRAAGGEDFAFGGAGDDHILGGEGIDSLTGAADDDFLNGGDGADNLDGGLGDDTLLGRADNDSLNGGAGGDVIIGGTGIDTARFIAQSTVNLLNPGQNAGEAKDDEYSSVEIFSFDSGNDRFVGDTLANTVLGGSGNDNLSGGADLDFLRGEVGDDTLRGGDGNDTLRGGPGNDTIVGDAGADTIDGEDGNDTLQGGAGNDRMTGGTGGDRFVFRGESGADTIANFARGADKLAVSKSGFGFATLRVVVDDTPVATANTGTFLFDTDDGRLRYDDNGARGGGVSLVATLQNLQSLSAGDFVLLA